MSKLSKLFNSVATPATAIGFGLGGGVGGTAGAQTLGNILTGQAPTQNLAPSLTADVLGLGAGAGLAAGGLGAGGAYDAANLFGLEAGDLGGGIFGTADPGVTGGTTGLFGLTPTQLALAGKLGAGALGLFGASQRARAQKRQQNEFAAMSAPYRTRLQELYDNPNAYLSSEAVQAPIQQGTTQLARSLSTQGNPAGSGNALQAIQNYASTKLSGALGDEKARLAGLSGIPNYNAAAPGASQSAIDAKGGIYNVLGGTLYDVTNPQPSLEEILKKYGIGGGIYRTANA